MSRLPLFVSGPWECSQTSNHAHDYRLTWVGRPMPFTGNEQARANARLIEQAPQMYYLLHACLRKISGDDRAQAADVLIEQIQRLFGKVEGE